MSGLPSLYRDVLDRVAIARQLLHQATLDAGVRAAIEARIAAIEADARTDLTKASRRIDQIVAELEAGDAPVGYDQ